MQTPLITSAKFWTESYFPYLAAACSVCIVLVMAVVVCKTSQKILPVKSWFLYCILTSNIAVEPYTSTLTCSVGWKVLHLSVGKIKYSFLFSKQFQSENLFDIIRNFKWQIFCCCRRRNKEEQVDVKEEYTEPEQVFYPSLKPQQIFYPSIKPDVKHPVMIQPEGSPVFVTKGCVAPVQTQAKKIKAKGLLERWISCPVYMYLQAFVYSEMFYLKKNTCTGIHKPIKREYNFQIWFSIAEATNEGKK